MKKIIQVVSALVLSSVFISAAYAGEQSKTIVLQLKGPGDLLPQEENPSSAPEGALCYAMDLVSPKTNKVIGSGNDCFTDLTANSDGSVVLTNTTFFFTPAGTLISEGLVSIVPVPRLPADGGVSDVDGGSPSVTHLTGSIPDENSGDSILGGSGRFANASGTVRLSGAVNMSNFPDSIIFDCLFVINID